MFGQECHSRTGTYLNPKRLERLLLNSDFIEGLPANIKGKLDMEKVNEALNEFRSLIPIIRKNTRGIDFEGIFNRAFNEVFQNSS